MILKYHMGLKFDANILIFCIDIKVNKQKMGVQREFTIELLKHRLKIDKYIIIIASKNFMGSIQYNTYD
jgi:hypothetical protein